MRKSRMWTAVLIGMILLSHGSAERLVAQTLSAARTYSYLHPADSIVWELKLEAGDVLEWSVWLAAAGDDSPTVLTIASPAEGERHRREFGAGEADVRDTLRISRAGDYRVALRTEGGVGRLASLGVWPRLGRKTTVPFPPPGVQRFTRDLSSGDVVAVSFELAAPKKTSFTELFALDLPTDVVRMWAKTAEGDSLPAAATVKRWVGDPGRITLRGAGPQGGYVTLRLEVNMPFDGKAEFVLAPGAARPDWAPKEARALIEQRHDVWGAVVVPPATARLESLRTAPPETPRADYVALSLRSRGCDSLTVARFRSIYGERDSLRAARRIRERESTRYDTAFLRGERSFLPPDLHVILRTPLTGEPPAKFSGNRRLQWTWFVQGEKDDVARCQLYGWTYDEARVALADLRDEFFWDEAVVPLAPTLRTAAGASFAQPQSLTLEPPIVRRADDFEREGVTYVDASQRVWGYYLSNPTSRPVALVYRETYPVRRAALYEFSKWPAGAKALLGILILVAGGGVWAALELRARERRRRHRALELAEELEKARQVQLKLLPQEPLALEGLEIYGIHQSMQSVGGDYYDFFPLDNGRIVICIADVTGHGLPAALVMANVQAALHAVAPTCATLDDVVTMLNQEIFKRTTPDNFVTMLIAVMSPDRRQLCYCNAGHNPGYLIRLNGDITELDQGGIMLGAMDFFPFEHGEVNLEAGDVIAFYTDGIPEAEIGAGEMYGYERLKFLLQQERKKPLPDVGRDLLRRVTPEGGKSIEDDMALVLVRVQ